MIDAKLDMSGFEARRKAIAKAPLVATKRAIVRGVEKLKYDLREDAFAALGDRAGFWWTSNIYPAGARLANSPSGLIFSRAPEITETFEYGATIKGARKNALYIPIKGTPADIKAPRKASRVGLMIARFGRPLELPQKDGTGWLLLFKTRTARKSGNKISAFVRDRKTGGRLEVTRGVEWTPFFVVEPEVKIKKRLNARAIIADFERAWPDMVGQLMAEELSKA
jgi:hypothetical protein